jgi:hypothetical protein
VKLGNLLSEIKGIIIDLKSEIEDDDSRFENLITDNRVQSMFKMKKQD